ncbi:hypothetical protein ACHAAC_04415 [Aeromicrobium sp. CF4.19]
MMTVTHEMQLARETAGRIVVMPGAELVVEKGSTALVLGHPKHPPLF